VSQKMILAFKFDTTVTCKLRLLVTLISEIQVHFHEFGEIRIEIGIILHSIHGLRFYMKRTVDVT